MFAGFLFCFFPIVYLIYPETTQRTLEDMDLIFSSNPSIFVFNNRNLTQRARPQDFIDAENERIAAAEARERKTDTYSVEAVEKV